MAQTSFLITGLFLDRLIVDKLSSSRAFRVQLVQGCSRVLSHPSKEDSTIRFGAMN